MIWRRLPQPASNGWTRWLATPVRAWNQVDELIATKRPKDYDAAVTLLQVLQALAGRAGEIVEFAERMSGCGSGTPASRA